MNILQLQEMLQASFDGMVDYAVSHSMPEPVSFGKVDDRLIMRLMDKHGNEYKATLAITLEVTQDA